MNASTFDAAEDEWRLLDRRDDAERAVLLEEQRDDDDLAGHDRPRRSSLYHLLRCALMNNGVDSSMNHGWISAIHNDEDLERTLQGYERAFQAMVAEGAFKSA